MLKCMNDIDLSINLQIPNTKEDILSLLGISVEHIRSWQYLNSLHSQLGQPLPLDVFLINFDLNNQHELFYTLLPYVKDLKIDDKDINIETYESLPFKHKINVFIYTIKAYAKIIEETELPSIYKQIDLPRLEKIQQAYKDAGISITSFSDAMQI
jgi:hypothetical protein